MTFPINKVSQFLTFMPFADFVLIENCFVSSLIGKRSFFSIVLVLCEGPVEGDTSDRIEKVEKKAKLLIGFERLTT